MLLKNTSLPDFVNCFAGGVGVDELSEAVNLSGSESVESVEDIIPTIFGFRL